jgi:hypothetical protein
MPYSLTFSFRALAICLMRSEFDKDLSQMITLDDINGDIHMHTTYSDGAYSIRDIFIKFAAIFS